VGLISGSSPSSSENTSRDSQDEADLSAESGSAQADSRVSSANEDAFGTGNHQATPCQGPQTPCRLGGLEVAMSMRAGRLRRSDRLLRSRDFQRVARAGRRRASRYFVVLLAPSCGAKSDEELPPGSGPRRNRLGITVSRKVGRSVVRNRIKRCVREWFRSSREQLGSGLDLVVIARRGAAELSSDAISGELATLTRALSRRRPRRG